MNIKGNGNVFFIFLLLMACAEKNDFSRNEQKIPATIMDYDFLIGQPSEIVCIDTIIFMFDKYENKAISVINAKNNRLIGRFLNVGAGPDEAIMPIKLFVSQEDKKLYVFQGQTGRLYGYNLQDILNLDFKKSEEYLFPDRPANLVKSKNGFVGIGMFDDGRLRQYSMKGDYLNPFGKYPFKGEQMSPLDRFFLYQGSFCTNSEGDRLAIGTSYCDNLEFFNLNNNFSLLKRYETYDVDVQFKDRVIINDDCVMNYKRAYGGKYCYMLYSGETYLQKNKMSAGGKKILVFDWDGNCLRSFSTDEMIISFCVDEANEMLYAIIYNNAEFKIAQYSIA